MTSRPTDDGGKSRLGICALLPLILIAVCEASFASRTIPSDTGLTTHGSLGTTTRYGYIEGAGPQLPGVPDPSASWKLGTLTFGSAGSSKPTDAPATTWGQLGFGWRTSNQAGGPADGLKIGRAVLPGGLGLSTNLGWSWQLDGGERLASASAGQGSLTGEDLLSAFERFRYSYGKADELQQIIEEHAGTITGLTTSPEGKITARDGVPFTYDASGRRTEDDRFTYTYDWRGRLAAVTVSDRPGATHAGEQIRYLYDAMGRLLERRHLGALPQGSSDDATRPFIADTVCTWEGSRLALQQGRNFSSILLWQATYLPGPGLDDAAEVRIDTFDPQAPNSPPTSTRTFTLLRDEQGSVIGVIEEKQGADPNAPPLLARYLYTPYGEAHAETGPELRHVNFDPSQTQLDTGTATITQTIQDPTQAASGGLLIELSIPIAASTLGQGLIIERLDQSGTWTTLTSSDVAIGWVPSTQPGQGSRKEQLLVLATQGWQRGSTYRVRLTASLTDAGGRALAQPQTLSWSVPASSTSDPNPAVIYEQDFPISYDTQAAASATLQGAFPSGQESLFQGLWTDPVTGLAYARNRWYDPRNASWLSEDPQRDVDSPNLYAFVGWQPNMATDPMGECLWLDNVPCLTYAGELAKAISVDTPRDLGNLAANALTLGISGRMEEAYKRGEVRSFGDSLRVAGSAVTNTVTFGTRDFLEEGYTGGELAKKVVSENVGVADFQRGIQEVRQGEYGQAAAAFASGTSKAALATTAVIGGAQALRAGVSRRVMQRLTTQANEELAANPTLAREVLRPGEYAAGTRSPRVAPMQYGNAVERIVAEQIESPILKHLYEHIGGPSQPDFIGRSFFKGLNYDITTPAQVGAHLARPGYGQGLLISTYERPSGFRLFPKTP